jgi:transposase
MELKRISIDTSKHVFTVHGVDMNERPVLRRELNRTRLETFFQKQPTTEIVLEACGSSHHWGRTLQAMGHTVRLIPPQYVKPFVKRGKNDRNDAEAICEAASRPTMRFVPVKSAQQQAGAMLLSVRELLVKQRTQAINALRGHAAEFGIIAAKGITRVDDLIKRIAADTTLPGEVGEAAAILNEQISALDARLAQVEVKLAAQHKASPVSQRLAAAPGIGRVTALTLASRIDATQFESGRHFAAWIGLTPKEHSTGGKQRLGGISRAGDERLRQLLVVGATSVIKAVVAKPTSPLATPWLTALLARRPRKLAAVALANKMARIVWAMMVRGEAYRQSKPAC